MRRSQGCAGQRGGGAAGRGAARGASSPSAPPARPGAPQARPTLRATRRTSTHTSTHIRTARSLNLHTPQGTFKLTLEFTEEYPNKAPVVKFKSQMFHPNSEPLGVERRPIGLGSGCV